MSSKDLVAEPLPNPASDPSMTDEFTVTDVAALCHMTADTGFFSGEEVAIVEELALAALAHGEESGYHFILAVPDPDRRDTVAGFTCYGPIPCTKGSWDLYWIVVRADMQGHGYGGRLLREVERRIGLTNGRKLFLETSDRAQYAPTRKFYEAMGFRLEARMVDYYDQGEDCLVFAKNIG